MNIEHETARSDGQEPSELTEGELAAIAGGVPILAIIAVAVAGELVREIAKKM